MQKLLLLVGLCVLMAHFEATGSQRLVCSFQSIPDFHMATDMDPELCTHIIFKSVQPNNAMEIPSSGGPILDHEDFKTEFPSTPPKTLLEVDLTQTSSTIFTLPKRATFIASVISVVNAADFDGVNILWKQSGPFDQQVMQGFTLLMQELKEKLEEEPGELLLTASVSGVPSVIQKSYEVPQLVGVVDFFNVMTADRDRTSTPVGTFPNAIAGMQRWVIKGAPTAKLNMGIATYGVDISNNANPRIWPKSQVCAAASPPATLRIDSDATIDAKAQHIKDENFGGAFVTSLQLDDFDGVACAAGPFPVIQRIKNII